MSNKIIIKIKDTLNNKFIPFKKHSNDFCYDLYVNDYKVILNGFGMWQVIYYSGIYAEIPDNYGVLLFPRSSIVKTRLRLSNSVGIIDSGYRGDWMAIFDILGKLTDEDIGNLKNNKLIDGMYNIGDRFCQVAIFKRRDISWVLSNNIQESERSIQGWGSTGN